MQLVLLRGNQLLGQVLKLLKARTGEHMVGQTDTMRNVNVIIATPMNRVITTTMHILMTRTFDMVDPQVVWLLMGTELILRVGMVKMLR